MLINNSALLNNSRQTIILKTFQTFCPFSYLGGESSLTSKRFGTSQAFTEGAGAIMLVITFSLLFSFERIPSTIPSMASLLTGLPWKLSRSSWPVYLFEVDYTEIEYSDKLFYVKNIKKIVKNCSSWPVETSRVFHNCLI